MIRLDSSPHQQLIYAIAMHESISNRIIKKEEKKQKANTDEIIETHMRPKLQEPEKRRESERKTRITFR